MRILAIAKKVMKELLRDKRTLAMMFVAPVFIMWLMNLMFSASTAVNIKLATQDLPTSLVTKWMIWTMLVYGLTRTSIKRR